MHRSGIGQREPALNRDTARPQALRQIRCRRARQGGDLGQPAQIGLHIALGRHRLPARLPLKAARRRARFKGQRHRAQLAIQKGAELAQGQIGGKGLSLQHGRQHHLHRTFKVRDRGFHGQILQIDPRARAMINKHQPPPRHRGATERKGRAHTRRCRADRPATCAAKDPILPPIAGALQKKLRRHSGHGGDLGLPADQRCHIHRNFQRLGLKHRAQIGPVRVRDRHLAGLDPQHRPDRWANRPFDHQLSPGQRLELPNDKTCYAFRRDQEQSPRGQDGQSHQRKDKGYDAANNPTHGASGAQLILRPSLRPFRNEASCNPKPGKLSPVGCRQRLLA